MSRSKITIVTREEETGFHEHDFKAFAFGSYDNAVKWIDEQIAALVKQHGLDDDSDVEGWFVQVEGWAHTVQFDAKEEEVL